MSRLLTLALALAFAFAAPAWSQITVVNNFQPVPGTLLQSFLDGAVDSAFFASVSGGSGGPMNWNFTSRIYGLGFNSYIVTPASTPYIDSFPGANLVLQTPVGNDTTWSVHQSNSNEFFRMGTVTRGTIGLYFAVYRNITAEWQFPIQNGDQWTGHRNWTQHNPPLRTEIFDTTYNTADAWGTAQRGTRMVPCLRVMSHEAFTYNTYDSSDVLIMTFNTDIYIANFIGAGFSTLVTVSKVVTAFGTSYNGSASGEFLGLPSDVDEPGAIPREFGIAQNYPNPFNPMTTIQYDLPRSADVTLEIFDILGRRVESLVDDNQPAGRHHVTWDASGALSGVYFYRIQAGDYSETKRMTLIK